MESALKEIEEYNRQRSILQKAANDLSETDTIESSEFRRDILNMVDMVDRKIKILKSEYLEDYTQKSKDDIIEELLSLEIIDEETARDEFISKVNDAIKNGFYTHEHDVCALMN